MIGLLAVSLVMLCSAVGTIAGAVYVFTHDGQRRWAK